MQPQAQKKVMPAGGKEGLVADRQQKETFSLFFSRGSPEGRGKTHRVAQVFLFVLDSLLLISLGFVLASVILGTWYLLISLLPQERDALYCREKCSGESRSCWVFDCSIGCHLIDSTLGSGLSFFAALFVYRESSLSSVYEARKDKGLLRVVGGVILCDSISLSLQVYLLHRHIYVGEMLYLFLMLYLYVSPAVFAPSPSFLSSGSIKTVPSSGTPPQHSLSLSSYYWDRLGRAAKDLVANGLPSLVVMLVLRLPGDFLSRPTVAKLFLPLVFFSLSAVIKKLLISGSLSPSSVLALNEIVEDNSTEKRRASSSPGRVGKKDREIKTKRRRVDATLFYMQIAFEVTQLTINGMVAVQTEEGPVFLENVALSTCLGTLGYYLSLSWSVYQESKANKAKGRKGTAPGRRVEVVSPQESILRMKGAAEAGTELRKTEREENARNNRTKAEKIELLGGEDQEVREEEEGEVSLALFLSSRMAINLVLASLCGAGGLLALQIFRRLLIQLIYQCESAFTMFRFEVDLAPVLAVCGVMWLFVLAVQALGVDFLSLWEAERRSLFWMVTVILFSYGQYFYSMLLSQILSRSDSCPLPPIPSG